VVIACKILVGNLKKNTRQEVNKKNRHCLLDTHLAGLGLPQKDRRKRSNILF